MSHHLYNIIALKVFFFLKLYYDVRYFEILILRKYENGDINQIQHDLVLAALFVGFDQATLFVSFRPFRSPSAMSHHLRTLQLPPLSSKTPTANPHSFSLHCFRFSFGFHCSVSCGCARQISPVRFSHQASLQEEGKPVSLYFQPVSSETHFDLLLDQAQRLHQAVVVVW